MNKKIGMNEPCPCGSGKKYKKCCWLNNEQDLISTDIQTFRQQYKMLRKEARFKECLHPNKNECSEKIIFAHSIQNNKILSKISDDGKVFMPCPKPGTIFPVQLEKYGRKEATTFTGFCSFHDKTVFQAIEDYDFVGTEEQVFLYTYRAFAHEYHKKREAVRFEKAALIKQPGYYFALNKNHYLTQGFDLSVIDFEKEKIHFDNAIINRDYSILTSFVWQFDGFSNFAASGGWAPAFDFDNNLVQDLLDSNVPACHIYINVFPENDKTNVIIAWLKIYDDIFSSIKQRFEKLTEIEKKNYVNNSLPLNIENIVIKPSSWENLSKEAKEEFMLIFSGFPEYMELKGEQFDRLKQTKYDFFSM